MKKLNEFKVTLKEFIQICLIKGGNAARERANEWDYAAGHAVAYAGVIRTLSWKRRL